MSFSFSFWPTVVQKSGSDDMKQGEQKDSHRPIQTSKLVICDFQGHLTRVPVKRGKIRLPKGEHED